MANLALWSNVLGFGNVQFLPSANNNCRVIEQSDSALKYDRLDSFLLSIDTRFRGVTSVFQQYKASQDALGKECMKEIILRLNNSLSEFSTELENYRDEKIMLDLYLKDPEFLGRKKRSTGAIILAIMISISNFAATGLNIALSQLRLNNFDARLTMMAERIQILQTSQSAILNNLELLFEKDEFLGIQTNLIKEHVNLVQNVHSCNLVAEHVDSMVSNMERKMFEIKDSMYSNRLSIGLIDRKSLSSVTRQALFEHTIYRISPSLLYDYAHADLVSFEKGKATFLISYPVISRKYEYKMYEIYESPKIVGQTSDFHIGFLAPYHMTLTAILNDTSVIRSPKYCKRQASFRACPDIFFGSNCIHSLLLDKNVSSNCPMKNESQTVTYTRTGALIDLKQKDKIIDQKSQYLVYGGNKTNASQCVFLPERSQLTLVSNSKKQTLFPNTKIQRFMVKPIVQSRVRLFDINNLSLPVFQSNLTKQSIEIRYNIDYAFVIGVTIGACLLSILLFHAILCLCKHKVCVIDGKNLFS